MHLWTEYEGNTLAGYLLGRLVRSEGRNAFFLTTTPEGQPAMLRLTESHFDEGELISRWRQTAAVAEPHLQRIRHFGQTNFDNVPLACCLLEPTDASLSDVLRERVLTLDETKEVAEAVARALAALHAAGLIHEHIDATNVFAVGEMVKLRSDCVRECTGDFEADTPEAREALRQRDVRDLGLLLLRCLTVDWQGSTAVRLPSPFNYIIPGALEDTLTAEGIVASLDALKPALITTPAAPVATTVRYSAPVAASPSLPAAPADVALTAARHDSSAPSTTVTPIAARRDISAAGTSMSSQTDSSPDAVVAALANREDAASRPLYANMQRLRPAKPRDITRQLYIASGALAAVLFLVLWMIFGGARHTAAAPHAVVAASTPGRPQASAEPQLPKPSAITEVRSRERTLLTSGEQAGWHVIAYTYNYEQQAQNKVLQLQSRYVSLHPQVFSPTGHAPYFVALGGPSDAASAVALRNRARQVGLPRDTYARSF